MSRTRVGTAVATAVLAVVVVAGASSGAVAAPANGTGTAAGSVGTTADHVTLEWSTDRAAAAGIGDRYSENLIVDVEGGTVTFGPDASVRLRVRNVDTGASVTYAPAADATTYEVDEFDVGQSLPRTIEKEINVGGPNASLGRNVPVDVTGDESTYDGGTFDRYVVELVDDDGTVLAATDPRVHGSDVAVTGMRYNGSALAVDLGTEIPADWHVVLEQGFDPVTTMAVDGDTVATSLEDTSYEDDIFGRQNTSLDANQSFSVDLYAAENDPVGQRVVSAFLLEIEPGDRVDGPVRAVGGDGGDGGDGPAPGAPDALPGAVGDPTDPDGDGTFEDVDGSGSVDFLDVVFLFERFDGAAVGTNAAFDFDGSGSITFLDVVALLEAV